MTLSSTASAPRAFHSEVRKALTIRSIRRLFVASVLVGTAFGSMLSATAAGQESYRRLPTTEAVSGILAGPTVFTQLLIGIAAVLLATGEYQSGTIRPTFTATPRRHRVLMAKAGVAACLAAGASLITFFLTLALSASVLAEAGIGHSLLDPAVIAAVLGACAQLAIVAVFSIGLGMGLRGSALSVSLVTALLFVAPFAGQIVGSPSAFALPTAAAALTGSLPPGVDGGPSSTVDGLIVALWMAAAWVPATVVTIRRDV